MTNLTDKWKKGELPSGWYYVKGNRAEGIYAYTAEYLNNMYRPRNGEKIIEQVPSYESWKKHRKVTAETQIKNCDLEITNTKLKELLKECRSPINYALCLNLSKEEKIELKSLLVKIKQALGEE